MLDVFLREWWSVPGLTPHYPQELKRKVVELYRSSEKSVPKVARGLGIADKSSSG
jgi:transposase-like protein